MSLVDERRRLIPRRLDDQEEESGSPCCFPRIQNKRVAQGSVLLIVALDKLAFYSLIGNLVLFLNSKPFQWNTTHAASAYFFFLGISFIFCFFGGWLADAKLGRFRAILIAILIYIIGYLFFPLLAHSHPSFRRGLCASEDNATHSADYMGTPFDERCAGIIYAVLAIIAIAAGMLKANFAPFGADQSRGPSSVAFFNWYYWSINMGTLVALSGIAYVQQNVTPNGFFYGYLSAFACLVLSLIILMAGKCTYIRRKPVGNIFFNIYKIFREALRIKKIKKEQKLVRKNYAMNSKVDAADQPEVCCFLDHAKFRYGGSFHDHVVDDVKKLGKILCVFIALVPYWMVYFQTESTFLIQGLHMRLDMNGDVFKEKACIPIKSGSTYIITPAENNTHHKDEKFKIVAVWLSLFDVVLLIILLPLMDRVVYPALSKRGINFTMVKRIALGLVFSILSMVVAGVVETERLNTYWQQENPCCFKRVNQTIGITTYNAADMSVLWQIPQYVMIGLSEVFASVAGLEFACIIAPKSMRSSVMGLFYFFSGIGSFVGVGIMYALTGTWFHAQDDGNINCRENCKLIGPKTYSYDSCQLNYFFFLLGGIQFVGLLAFVGVVWKFNLKQDPLPHNSGHTHRRRHFKPKSVVAENHLVPTIAEINTGIESQDSIGDTVVAENINSQATRPIGEVNRTIHRNNAGRILPDNNR